LVDLVSISNSYEYFISLLTLKIFYMKQTLPIFLMAIALLFIGSCKNQSKGPEPPKIKAMNTKVAALDAVKVAPAHYRMINEKHGIRVLEVNYKPGETSPMHSHPDNVLYVVTDGKAEFTGADGIKHIEDLKKGTARVLPAGTHSVKNVGTAPMKAYLFEINHPNEPALRDPAMDAENVAPSHYKVLQDSMNIRILQVDYKPGESSLYHAHPVNAIYVLMPGKMEFNTNGHKQVVDLKTGMTNIFDRESHSVKNVGKTEVKLIDVEVNRK
jgi:quercetin dioxygenase-like cupin family protein